MVKNLIFLTLLTSVFISCKDSAGPEEPEPLTISIINGFVSTGSSTFQVTNLLTNETTADVLVSSPFFVIFDKPVNQASLSNETLPRLMLQENGESVAGVSLNITVTSSTELTLEPQEPLTPGADYWLVINPGYDALDGGTLEDHVWAYFSTSN